MGWLVPRLLRIPGFHRMWCQFPYGGVALRTQYDVWPRPNYAYGVYWSAYEARLLGLPRITVAEFGVAGGSGLVALEQAAETISAELGVAIDVVGFDGGQGMPPPADYRDLPHCWEAGFYQMDEAALRARLKSARLVIGRVEETVPAFIEAPDVAPIGFIAFDLDYYSSTKAAFRIFDIPRVRRLPRVYCYFDDIIWPPFACQNDRVGERLAIAEFNEVDRMRYIAPIEGLRWMRPMPAIWNDMMYAFHDFGHPLYGKRMQPRGDEFEQLPLAV